MQEERKDPNKCYICHQNPIHRICLNEEKIQDNTFLFCDSCRKTESMRKFAMDIYQIDSFSAPLSILSINSIHKQKADSINNNVKYCRVIIQERLLSIFGKIGQIQDNSLIWLESLGKTFQSDTAQNIQTLLTNPNYKGPDTDIKKQVQLIKWLKQNKQSVQNPDLVEQKVQKYTKSLQQSLNECHNKICLALDTFLKQTNCAYIFDDQKQKQLRKQQKNKISLDTTIKHIKKKIQTQKNQPKSSLTEVQQKIKPFQNKRQTKQSKDSKDQQKRIEQQISEKHSKSIKELQFYQSRNFGINEVNENIPNITIQRSDNLIQRQDSNVSEEKQINNTGQMIVAENSQQKKNSKKKNIKSSQMSQKEEEIKLPPLILSKLKTKNDYQQDEKLIINLRSIPEIFLNIHLTKEPRLNSLKIMSIRQIKTQQQSMNGNRKNKQFIHQYGSIDIEEINFKRINFEKMLYLEIQQLPKLHEEFFSFKTQIGDIQVPYSFNSLHHKLDQMMNLQQIHVFSSNMFPQEQSFLNVFFTCSQLQVVTFNCYNSINRILENYKQIIGEVKNKELKIFEIAGNIPFHQKFQLSDLKRYFPESQKNTKIFDQYFVKNFDIFVKKQKQIHEDIFAKKQKQVYQHKHSCWYIPKQCNLIQKQRKPIILAPDQCEVILDCFDQLRNCWIPYLQQKTFETLKQKMDFRKIQHLTLGFHSFLLQPIPQSFFSGSFSKSLTNLQSLNLINLTIYDMFFKTFFRSQWKTLVSLKLQNCVGLKNDFYFNLPQYCPQLEKLSVNNLSKEINGDFIMKFSKLSTVILPWSEMEYRKSERLVQMQMQQAQGNQNSNQNIIAAISQNKQSESYENKKNFTFINIYGCTWFNSDFFSLIKMSKVQHLNIGKCKGLDIKALLFYLKMAQNIKSLCMDEIQVQKLPLFKILYRLQKLQRLSVAYCTQLNFRQLTVGQIQILDRMTHLDLRNREQLSITADSTLLMVKPKYLIISRGFDVQSDEMSKLAKRQIYAFTELNSIKN